MILLLFFIFLFLFIKRKPLKVFHILVFIQILSLFLMVISAGDTFTVSISRMFNIVYTALILTLIIYPWRHYDKINFTYVGSERKVIIVTKVLLILSVIVFFVLLFTGIWVMTNVSDINKFKYVAGERMEVLSNNFPISMRWFLFSNYLYVLSYFLIPLHFYFIGKSKFYSALCLLFSFNIVLYGLSFFSRWTLTHYILIYGIFLFLYRDSISEKYLKNIKRIFFVVVLLLSYMMYYITVSRFEMNQAAYNRVPNDSFIQNPALYSSVSYFTEWYNNSLLLLDNYSFETFNGQATFLPILKILNSYTPVSWDLDKYMELRESILTPEYYKNFAGLVANWVFDFGYILSLLSAVVYNRIIYRLRPRNNRIKLKNTLLLVLLIQLPLVSIFYSFMGGIITSLIILIPINLYLNKYK